ncbi:HNH endonuclease [Stutzerimonas stutzeri]|uniref:HNH endonuclease signature motif containing protein n=1 Tax=Stutzerimonas stutzeri TaxID=316 RepID=UPI00163B4F34|nr:HNH endonuclease [Stutzerimonas stutzeri]
MTGSHRCQLHKVEASERKAEVRKEVHREYNLRRDESDSFYKTERWKKLSAYYRKKHPVCECCENAASDITDHIKPVKTHPDLALDWDNLRALCRPCHNSIGERVGLLDAHSSHSAKGEGGSKV